MTVCKGGTFLKNLISLKFTQHFHKHWNLWWVLLPVFSVCHSLVLSITNLQVRSLWSHNWHNTAYQHLSKHTSPDICSYF